METDKCMENLLRAAFIAGARFGARYPEPNSWPVEEQDIQFKAWLADWHGHTWSPQDWLEARVIKGLVRGPVTCARCNKQILWTDGHWESKETGSWCVNEWVHEPALREPRRA